MHARQPSSSQTRSNRLSIMAAETAMLEPRYWIVTGQDCGSAYHARPWALAALAYDNSIPGGSPPVYGGLKEEIS